MGKKGYNAKARQINKTAVDNSETKKITIEFENNEYGGDNESNLLALPSKKRKTKIIKEKVEKTRILSKAQRKRLEKIVDKKKKKENRAALLEALSQVQVSNEELSKMTSITAVQTIGVRNLSELYLENKQPTQAIVAPPKYAKMSSIAGARKRKRLLLLDDSEVKRTKTKDPNVVGLDPESSDDEDSSDEEVEDVDNETSDQKQDIIDIVTDDVPKQTEISTAVVKDTETLREEPNNEKRKSKRIVNGKTPVLPDVKPSLKNDNKLVNLQRDPKIQVARLKLPILGEEQNIVEAINENEIVILAGETGSGKTTQVPQFLYEAGYATSKLIGITEPRRVATVAMSTRVGFEMGLSSREVSYLMRFEGNVTKETKIKFMTDGVLLKEVQTDFLLTRYSVIIIDEAHERSVYTDILIGLLSRIVPLRRKRGIPLRLIIMSATLRVEDFTENTRLFKNPPPVIKVESRQFPVTVHFNKKTHEDYLKEAYRKAVKIHTKLPDGGILIFVTGQQEVRSLVRKLKNSFPYRSDINYAKQITKRPPVSDMSLDSDSDDAQSDDDEVEREMKRALRARKKAKLQRKMLPKISLDDYEMPPDDGQADLVVSGDESEGHLDSDTDPESDNLTASIKACRQPLWVLPLYSMLGAEGQARVFAPPPVGTRLCVVSTDVAETSLTIPGVKYVVDTGKKKTRLYDGTTGASAFRITWTSQAGAAQRSGRAGRTAPGHCYRLYSSAVFQHEFQKFATPDIQMKPVDELMLQMKCMGIDKVVNFPFPTAPDRMQLRMAEHRLKVLGILEVPVRNTPLRKNQEEVLKVTALGKAVAAFPVLPRYGKMLALSHQQDLLPYAVAMVSALSVPEVISGKGESWPATGQSLLLGDPGVLLRAIGAAEYANSRNELELFCAKHGLREKAVKEIRKLRWQLTSEIKLSVAGVNLTVEADMKPPTEDQARLLRQLLLSGLGDQVAKKVAIEEVKEGEDKRKFKYAYHCGEMEEVVHLHSSSILRRTIPEWVVYQEIYEASGKLDGAQSKIIMRGATAIEPEWLPVYVPDLCNMGEPLTDPAPRYNPKTGRVLCHINSTFGRAGWPLPVVEMHFPNKLDLYKWFGRFILDGTVCEQLKKYTSSLLSPPATMVKSWARLQPRTELFCKTLAGVQVGSRDALMDMWRHNPKFLLYEYLKWLPESAHNEVTLLWPPLR